MIITRIILDEEFITEAIKKATIFYKYGVLPELVGKLYTKAASMSQTQDASEDNSIHQAERKWCYCNGEDEGEMIGCEDDRCLIHTSYLKLSTIPDGKYGFVQTAERKGHWKARERKKEKGSKFYSNGTTDSQ